MATIRVHPPAEVACAGQDAASPAWNTQGEGLRQLAIQLIAVDIDGTLVDSQSHIPNANKVALRRAMDAGVEVVLVTGRRFETAAPVATELGLDLPIVVHNGALIRHAITGNVEYHQPLPLHVAAAVLPRILAHQLDPIAHYALEDASMRMWLGPYADPHNAWLRRYVERNAHCVYRVPDLLAAMVAPPTQLMCGGVPERVHPLRDALLEQLRGRMRLLETSYPELGLTFLDIIHPECSKAHAIQRLAAARGLMREQILAIGDNFNDLPMLEYAGTAVVMGNAPPELRKAGFHVTDTNERAGLAKAVERFVG